MWNWPVKYLASFKFFELLILPLSLGLCLKSVQGDCNFLFLRTHLDYVSRSKPRVKSDRIVLIWREIGTTCTVCSVGVSNCNIVNWRPDYKRCSECQRSVEWNVLLQWRDSFDKSTGRYPSPSQAKRQFVRIRRITGAGAKIGHEILHNVWQKFGYIFVVPGASHLTNLEMSFLYS
jgi:hypothetical protein